MSEVISANYSLTYEALMATGRSLRGQLAEWMLQFYGDNCPEFCESCIPCRKWKAFQELFGDLDK